MWKSKGDMWKAGRCFDRTQLGIEQTSFIWALNRFSTLGTYLKKTKAIKTAAHESSLLDMNLFLTGEGQIQIEIIPKNCEANAIEFCSCKFSVLNMTKNSAEYLLDKILKFKGELLQKLPAFVSRSTLMSQKSIYLQNDTLSLKCEFTFYKGVVLEKIDSTKYGSVNDLPSEEMFRNPELNVSHSSGFLKNDLRSLYEKRILCDVKLHTKTFSAQKSILSARSSVFRDMLTSETKEDSKDYADILDVDAEIMRQMLLYMYTDNLEGFENFQWENVCRLYIAADKYKILTLKNKCYALLRANICPNEACDILIFADMHQNDDLKRAVQYYILSNSETLMISEEWKSLMKSHIQLAAETMHLKYL